MSYYSSGHTLDSNYIKFKEDFLRNHLENILNTELHYIWPIGWKLLRSF